MLTPAEVLELVDSHWVDRQTKLDNLLAEAVLVLYDFRHTLNAISYNLSKLTGEPGELAFLQNHFFSYPEDGRETELVKGTTTINYLTGKGKLPTGGKIQLADNLYNHDMTYVRSLMVSCDRTVYVRLDDKNAFPIPPSNFVPFYNQQFQKISIETTAETYLFLMASTSPEGIGILQPTGVLESHGYNRNKTLTTGSLTLSTAYDAADEHDVQAYIGRLGVNGFVLNKDLTETLYLWISTDGTTFYDPAIGLDVDYIPILPGAQLSLAPRTVHTMKVGASGGDVKYAVVII